MDAYQLPTGTIIVKENLPEDRGVYIYARVSSAENKDNLDSQAERLKNYCDDYSLIVVEHKERLTRFGFNYIKLLLKKAGKDIEVVNEAGNDKEDLIQDFTSIITSFCARIYGQRRSKRKTEKIIRELQGD